MWYLCIYGCVAILIGAPIDTVDDVTLIKLVPDMARSTVFEVEEYHPLEVLPVKVNAGADTLPDGATYGKVEVTAVVDISRRSVPEVEKPMLPPIPKRYMPVAVSLRNENVGAPAEPT